jgi:uncharacterized protein
MSQPAQPRITERDGGIGFDVVVATRASRERLGPVMGEAIKVAITAAPVEGKANEAIIALLARALGVHKKDVRIVAGEHGKRKSVRVEGASRATLLALLAEER